VSEAFGKTSLANVVRPTIRALDQFGKEEEVPERLIMKTVANTSDTFSSIWHKLFEEIQWPRDGTDHSTRDAFGLRDQLSIDDVRRVLSHTTGAVFIVDEFDQAHAVSHEFTQLIKTLSDLALDCTIILVGVAETVDTIIAEHASIGRATVQIRLERMKPEDLRQILEKAENLTR
jgi:hypothetical protein